jgi:2-polyprenyl-3-methyl-5-hydroxy-6-metoxy-1,4-benzoquinol methylase
MSDRFLYTADINLANVNDSHAFAVASVPARSDVLDVGAADGSVARVLQQMGCRVWGMEGDVEAAEQASAWCEEVIVGDVEQTELWNGLGRTFDVILFLDILEHLRDPLGVLRRALGFLADGGHVVLSLPNVAHAAVRAQLLTGRFRYTDLGIIDRTHLRFFDSVSVHELLDESGLVVLDESRVTFPLEGTEIPIETEALDPDLLEHLGNDPGSETYQFLFIAAPVGSAAVATPPFLPARVLQRELRSVQERLGSFESGGGVPRDDLIAELGELRRQSDSRRQVLVDLLAKVDENAARLVVDSGL